VISEMRRCRVHDVDYEDFCVLCSGTPQPHKKRNAILWVLVVLAFLAAFFIYNLVFLS